MLQEQIKRIRGKKAANEIAMLTLRDSSVYKRLLELSEDKDVDIARKAAWVVSAMFDIQKSYFKDQTMRLWELTLSNLPYSVERSLIRICAAFPIPDEIESKAFDFCMQRLINPDTPIANRAFAIDVTLKLVKRYPELAQEVQLLVPILEKLESPGVKVKLKAFNKLVSN